MQSDTTTAYGTVSRLLHWSMAALFAFMLFTAAAWNINEDYFSLVAYHKSAGFVLMLLAVLRAVWAFANRRRRPPSALPAKLGHAALYVLMLAVPFVGLLRQYGRAKDGLEVFGITVLPAAAEKIQWMTQIGNAVHGKLGWLLFALAAGHIVAAVVHQIKGEKIINRMIGK